MLLYARTIGNQTDKKCIVEDGKFLPKVYTSEKNYELLSGYEEISDTSFNFEIVIRMTVVLFVIGIVIFPWPCLSQSSSYPKTICSFFNILLFVGS